ncbi:MAG: carbohydrate ABC transporter permease [Treponema sp.]|jgi:ABC-type glycerol-3-phosphate transport system permease component|nr:carbohydrate ABC transporter permease [Treponema sp.]
MKKTEPAISKLEQNTTLGDYCISMATYIFFILFALACTYPFYYVFINTISGNKLSDSGVILFYPREVHFNNYSNAFRMPGLFRAAQISVARTVIGTFFTVLFAAFIGFMCSREHVWKRKFWYRFIVITMYFNAGVIPWFITMKNLGLTNNFWGYIFPAMVSPFFIILTKTFIESTPKELQESAEIDGAGILTTFFRILLPVSKPILATIAIIASVAQWNSFQDTLLLVTDNKLYTLQFVLYQYLSQAQSLASMVNAASGLGLSEAMMANMQTATSVRMTVTIIVVTPVILVYPMFQRFFVKGIMIGAVKG